MSRLEEIRAAGATMYMHLNFQHGHGYQHRCNAEPRIKVVVFRPKKRNDPKHKAYRDFVVDGVEERFQTLEEAVLKVEQLDRAAADDAEWDAAAPKKKRPPPLPEDQGKHDDQTVESS